MHVHKWMKMKTNLTKFRTINLWKLKKKTKMHFNLVTSMVVSVDQYPFEEWEYLAVSVLWYVVPSTRTKPLLFLIFERKMLCYAIYVIESNWIDLLFILGFNFRMKWENQFCTTKIINDIINELEFSPCSKHNRCSERKRSPPLYILRL